MLFQSVMSPDDTCSKQKIKTDIIGRKKLPVQIQLYKYYAEVVQEKVPKNVTIKRQWEIKSSSHFNQLTSLEIDDLHCS
jgi:hypothetical protein